MLFQVFPPPNYPYPSVFTSMCILEFLMLVCFLTNTNNFYIKMHKIAFIPISFILLKFTAPQKTTRTLGVQQEMSAIEFI